MRRRHCVMIDKNEDGPFLSLALSYFMVMRMVQLVKALKRGYRITILAQHHGHGDGGDTLHAACRRYPLRRCRR